MKRPSDRISSYFLAEWRVLSAVTLSGIIYNVGLSAVQVFEGKLIQYLADILGGSRSAADMIVQAALYVSAILIVQGTRAVKRLYVRKFSNNAGLRMKSRLYRSLLHMNPSSPDLDSAGSLMTKAISDADACAEGMRKVTTEVFDTGVALLCYAAMLFIYDPIIAASVILFPPAAVVCAELFRKKVTGSAAAVRESAGSLSSSTLDRLNNGLTYRVTGLETVHDGLYENDLEDYRKKSVISGLWSNGLVPIYRTIAFAGFIFIVILGGRNISGTGTRAWDIAAFTTFLSCYSKLAVKASKTSKLFNSVQKAGVSWKRIKPLLGDIPDECEPEPADPQRLSVTDLSVGYGGKTVFSGLSFEACPGEIIGVSGEVACGKSSLGRAFLCETRPDGAISFGGHDLYGLIAENRKHYVSYMGHSPELFYGTVEDNIRLGRDGDISDVLRTCAIDEEVASFPDGKDTLIGSGGHRLSGGQMARIALARTLFRHAPVTVLDDPFSAVDMKTERLIFDRLKKNNRGIIIIISHRLSVFPDTDKVVFIGNGSVSVSVHDRLLKESPEYAKLYSLQSGKTAGGDKS